MKDNDMCLVFVYGTLKKGFGNNRLLSHSKFMGNAVTQNKYIMRSNNYYPAIFKPNKRNKGDAVRINGEIYYVNKHTLKALDGLEGHPLFYKREIITVNLENNEQPYKVFAYIMGNDKMKYFNKHIKSGVFTINN